LLDPPERLPPLNELERLLLARLLLLVLLVRLLLFARLRWLLLLFLDLLLPANFAALASSAFFCTSCALRSILTAASTVIFPWEDSLICLASTSRREFSS